MNAVTELNRTTLTAFHDALTRAVKERDLDGFAALYTPDCVLLPPDGTVLRGREVITENFGRWVDGGFVDQVVEEVIDLQVGDSVAVEEAISVGTFLVEGEKVVKRNNYVVTFVKGADGAWLMDKDIWTTIPDEPTDASY